MRKWFNIQWLCVLIGYTIGSSLLFSCSDPGNTAGEAKRVLILQSYRSDCLWGEDLNRGAADCFRKHKIPVVFETFYMDSESLTDPEMASKLAAFLNETARPDLILVSADQALNVLLQTKHLLGYEVPIVFSGINYTLPASINDHVNITGLTAYNDYEKCVSLIQRLFPDTEKVYLDIDDSLLSRKSIEIFRQQTNDLDSPMQFEVTNLDASEGSRFFLPSNGWQQEVRIMPVWSSFYFGYARTIDAPFFAVNSKGFGYGYLGGYMALAYDQMYDAAEIGVQLLSGTSITHFPIRASAQKPVFDWVQLEKYHIPVDRLPGDSVIINMSSFDRYREAIIYTSAGFVFLLVFISVLLLVLSRGARSDKRKTQKELLEHRNKLKIVMSSIREGVISVDRNMHVFTINSAAMQYLNLEGRETDYEGKRILYLSELINEQQQMLEEMINQVLATGKSITFAEGFQMRSRATGVSFPVSGGISAIYQHDQLYGAVIVFLDDTEMVTRKEFLALTLKTGGYTSWYFDHEKRSIVLDPAFIEAHAIPYAGTNAISLAHFREMIHPDDVQEWDSVNHQLIHRTFDKYVLTIRMNLDGTGYQSWEIRFTCLRSLGANEIPLIFGLCSNVEESVQALQALAQARDKAQLSDRLKSAFLANMSHEIRTPLNAIVGFSNVLTSGDDFDVEERRLFVNTIRNNCNLLLGLISDVLDMAQIESGTMHYKDEVCNVNELIEQIIVSQRVIVPDRIQLIGKVPDETSYVITDRLRLNQVITNLINNAVKFTEKGSVIVGYERDDNGYHFYVEDTGRGIPEKDIDHIFKRFFKKDDFAQGAGLGLSICQMIVDHYKGTIGVTSTEGVGSRFVFSIPFVGVDEWGEVNEPHENMNDITYKLLDMNTTSENQLSQDRVTLLIAEDEESNYLLLKTVLQKQCNLIRAKTGKEALELYKEYAAQISLIMLDIKMPEMTGIEALKEIRKITKDIPIIMQSAYVFDTDMEAARQAGATDFITKPINLKVLKSTITKFCPSVQW